MILMRAVGQICSATRIFPHVDQVLVLLDSYSFIQSIIQSIVHAWAGSSAGLYCPVTVFATARDAARVFCSRSFLFVVAPQGVWPSVRPSNSEGFNCVMSSAAGDDSAVINLVSDEEDNQEDNHEIVVVQLPSVEVDSQNGQGLGEGQQKQQQSH